jgi:UrcA family protein
MNISIQNTARAAAFFLGGAIALCALHVTAKAAEEGFPTRKVGYADLDISKPAGARVLYSRIVRAAHQVCGIDQFKNLATEHLVKECTDQAIDKAVNDVGSPALSAMLPSKPLKVASN